MKVGMMMEMISRWDRNEVADRVVMYNDSDEVDRSTFIRKIRTTH